MALVNARNYSDEFQRADNTDSGTGWDAGYTGLSNLQIVSNRVRPGAANTDCAETVNSYTPANDQWAQFDIPTFAGASITAPQLLLRFAAPATKTGYVFLAAKGLAQTFILGKYVAGSFTQLNAAATPSWTSGDVLRGTAVGTSLTMYQNGVAQVATFDAAVASGRFGAWLFTTTAVADLEIDNFAGGDVVQEPVGKNRRIVLQAVNRAGTY